MRLVDRYLESTGMKAGLAPVFGKIEERVRERLTDENKDQAWVDRTTHVIVSELRAMVYVLVGSAVAEHLTEDELCACIEFWETPVGRNIVAKTPAMVRSVDRTLATMAPAVEERIQAALRGETQPVGE